MNVSTEIIVLKCKRRGAFCIISPVLYNIIDLSGKVSQVYSLQGHGTLKLELSLEQSQAIMSHNGVAEAMLEIG